MFPLIFCFSFQKVVAFFFSFSRFSTLRCRFFDLVLTEVVFFQEKNQAIMNVIFFFVAGKFVTLTHVLIYELKDAAPIKCSPPLGLFHVLLFYIFEWKWL